MLRIAHRVNTLEALRQTPHDLGVEIDLHAHGGRLVVQHDAFTDGPDFESWLAAYAHRFLILNIKESGIERRAIEATLAHGIEGFFLFDVALPALVRSFGAEKRLAVRVSEYEPVAGALRLAGRAEWAWIDYFAGFALAAPDYAALKAAGFKLCLVSPDVHDQRADEAIELRRQIDSDGMVMDAVCTKRPDLWLAAA